MNINKAILAIAIMSLVTIALRFFPFLIFASKKKTPKLITYLGKVLPPAVMGMLVVYCLKNTSFSSISNFIPQLIASSIVVLSYLWKKNGLISILLGTIIYMLLV